MPFIVIVWDVSICQKNASLRIDSFPYNHNINYILTGTDSSTQGNTVQNHTAMINFYWMPLKAQLYFEKIETELGNRKSISRLPTKSLHCKQLGAQFMTAIYSDIALELPAEWYPLFEVCVSDC